MIDIDTRLRVARGFGKSETQADLEVFATLKRRGHPESPPPTVSDGWGGTDEAMVEVYGTVPAYSGRGRPPSRKRPQPGWEYLQVIKRRTAQGRVIGTRLRVVFGEPEVVLAHLTPHTAYSERTQLTMRQHNRRLVRNGLTFSKELAMHRAAAAWEDLCHNFVHPHKSLRVRVEEPDRRWQPRTPAMAAGLTDHIWTVKELLTIVIIP
jgi:hypothetical protein